MKHDQRCEAMLFPDNPHQLCRCEERRLRAELARARTEQDVAVSELWNIVNARRFDRDAFQDDMEFADWVRARCRHTLATIDAAREKEPSAMADLQRHPILRAIYDVMRAIERCGASPELTEAVVLAGRLSEQAATILDELDLARAELAREREESRGWIVLGMNAEAELARVRATEASHE